MSRTLVHSHTYPSSLPLLAWDSTAPFHESLSEAFSIDSQLDTDPFLVKSPHPSRFVRGSFQSNSGSGYDINLKNVHDSFADWSDDEIEEIMVISPKPALHKVATISNGNDTFHLLSVVGAGVTGKILLAKKPHSFKLYAIKRMRRSTISSNRISHDALSEQLVLKTITHLNAPFLPRLYSSFADSQYLYLVMDFCARGDLLTHLLKDGALDPEIAAFYSSEMVVAISSLHDAGIVHRDLKPENVLIEITGHIIITDFGCARSIPPGDSRMSISSSSCGTKEYQAPEMVLEWPHDFAVDIWGFGILVYLLNFGQHPFMVGDDGSADSMTIKQKILLGPATFSCEDNAPPLGDLVGKCLERNPALRLTMNDIKTHQYFSSTDWAMVASKQMPVPQSRILNGSNIYIPLNPTDDGFVVCSESLLSSDLGHTMTEVEFSLQEFSFEWDGSKEENLGLTDEVDHVSTLDHVPTLLNAIEEVSEGEDSTIFMEGPTPAEKSAKPSAESAGTDVFRRMFGTFMIFSSGPRKVWKRCRKTCLAPKCGVKSNPSQHACQSAANHVPDRPLRNRLRKRTRPPVTVNLPVDPVSSQSFASHRSLAPVLSVAETTQHLGSSGNSFKSKFSWKKPFSLVHRTRLLRSQMERHSGGLQEVAVEVIPEPSGDSWILPWGGSDLRLCHRHRIHGANS